MFRKKMFCHFSRLDSFQSKW